MRSKTVLLISIFMVGIVAAQATENDLRIKERHGADVECTDSLEQAYLKALDDTSVDNKETGGTVRPDELYGLWRICGKKNESKVAAEISGRLVNDRHPDVRREAAELIPLLPTYNRDESVVNALKSAVHDPVPKVRLEAICSLFKVGRADTNEILDSLISIAQGKFVLPPASSKGCKACNARHSQNLRYKAIQCLGKTGYEKANASLLMLADDPDTTVRAEAAKFAKNHKQ
jgi:HEAT repeat protein